METAAAAKVPALLHIAQWEIGSFNQVGTLIFKPHYQRRSENGLLISFIWNTIYIALLFIFMKFSSSVCGKIETI